MACRELEQRRLTQPLPFRGNGVPTYGGGASPGTRPMGSVSLPCPVVTSAYLAEAIVWGQSGRHPEGTRRRPYRDWFREHTLC